VDNSHHTNWMGKHCPRIDANGHSGEDTGEGYEDVKRAVNGCSRNFVALWNLVDRERIFLRETPLVWY